MTQLKQQTAVQFGSSSFWLRCLLLTIAVEVLTCVLRFGLQLESTRDTASTIGLLTFGVRIHHSYIGVLLLPIALIVERRSHSWSQWLLIIGLSLLISDLIHHFIVLWLITGSPQFDLLY